MSSPSTKKLAPHALPFLSLPCRQCARTVHDSFELLRARLIEDHGLPAHELAALLDPQAHDAPHPSSRPTELIFPTYQRERAPDTGAPTHTSRRPTELIFPDSHEHLGCDANVLTTGHPTELIFFEDEAAQEPQPADAEPTQQDIPAAARPEPPVHHHPPDSAPDDAAGPRAEQAVLESESVDEPQLEAPEPPPQARAAAESDAAAPPDGQPPGEAADPLAEDVLAESDLPAEPPALEAPAPDQLASTLDEPRAEPAAAPETPPAAAAPPLAGAPILLVLPENDIFTVVVAGHFALGDRDVALAHDAQQAHAALRRHGARLAILDFALREVPGFLDRVKLDPTTNAVPAAALLCQGSDPSRPDGLRIQAELELAQPFAIHDLFAAVARLLDRTGPEAARPGEFQLNFVLPSTREHLDEATDFAAGLFRRSGLAPKGQTELLTAFREAVGNAIQHGNLFDPDRTVYVQYRHDSAQVTLVIHDEGDGFDPQFYLEQARGKDAAHAARIRHEQGGLGGLGILMIHRCTDSLEYTNGGNTLTLTKRIAPAAPTPS